MKDLVRDNPMLAESRRVNGQLLKARSWTPTHTGVAVVAGAFYLLLLGLVVRYSSTFPPSVLTYILLMAVTLLVPLTLHGVIAGEREKRSLDMLLSAPVTSGQIIIAKVSRVLSTVAVAYVLLTIPTLLLIAAQTWMKSAEPWTGPQSLSAWILFPLSLLIIAAYGFGSAGVTLFVSSHSKSVSAALMSSVGAHIGMLLVAPIIPGLLADLSGESTRPFWNVWLVVHPFFALAYEGAQNLAGALFIFAANLVFWTAVGAAGLYLAANRLDQERKG